MTETKLSNSCKLKSEFGMLTLEYTEHSPDPWYSSTETCVEIEKEKAIELIKTMVQHFNGHSLTDDEADAIARLI
jgi:hypothetical protein